MSVYVRHTHTDQVSKWTSEQGDLNITCAQQKKPPSLSLKKHACIQKLIPDIKLRDWESQVKVSYDTVAVPTLEKKTKEEPSYLWAGYESCRGQPAGHMLDTHALNSTFQSGHFLWGISIVWDLYCQDISCKRGGFPGPSWRWVALLRRGQKQSLAHA